MKDVKNRKHYRAINQIMSTTGILFKFGCDFKCQHNNCDMIWENPSHGSNLIFLEYWSESFNYPLSRTCYLDLLLVSRITDVQRL